MNKNQKLSHQLEKSMCRCVLFKPNLRLAPNFKPKKTIYRYSKITKIIYNLVKKVKLPNSFSSEFLYRLKTLRKVNLNF